jgi:hypothetical protein
MARPKKQTLNTTSKVSELTPQQIVEEYTKCAQSVEYFLGHYALVPVPGTDLMTPLKLWKPQRKITDALNDIWANKEKNGLVLMASRQCGKTQIIEAVCVWLMLFNPNYVILHLNRDLPQGKQTINEIRSIIDNLPYWLKPQFDIDNKQEGFKFTNGSQFVLQASNKPKDKKSAKGRGRRPMFVWVDEAAFMPLEAHMASILPTTSRTFLNAKKYDIPYGIIFTSTPNGRKGTGEGYYNMVMDASTNPNSIYHYVSIYWWECPGYDAKWFSERCKENHCTAESPNQKVQQEYNLMFIGSDDSIFEQKIMELIQDAQKAKEPMRKFNYADGYIYWWDIPSPKYRYIVGIDTATEHGTDFSTVYVECYETGVQIAECKVKCTVKQFCNYYIPLVIDLLPNKVLVIERNGVGNQTIEELQDKYLHIILKDDKNATERNAKLGIHSTGSIRNLVVEQIFNVFNTEHENILSYNLRMEAAGLERKSSGRIEGQPDDLCFALGWVKYAKTYYDLTAYFGMGSRIQNYDEIDLNGSVTMVESDTNEAINMDLHTYEMMYGANKQLHEDLELYQKFKQNKSRSNSNYDTDVFSSVEDLI